jgi:hypothetical protein
MIIMCDMNVFRPNYKNVSEVQKSILQLKETVMSNM